MRAPELSTRPTRGLAAIALATLLALALAGACSSDDDGDDGASGGRSPDEVITGAVAVGARATLQGTVRAVTFDHHLTGDGWEYENHRWVLLQVTPTDDLTESQAQWGVGARWPGEKIRSREWAVPQVGDVIRVTGVVQVQTFGIVQQEQRYLLEEVEGFEVLASPVGPLADVGEACGHDVDCMDDLLCDRDARVCELVPRDVLWEDDFRNVNGACDTDADCPIGQVCDPAYRIKGEGDFRAPYRFQDVGRNLCQVPDREAPIAELCPRFVTADDVASGRYPGGKEVCIVGGVALPIFNPGDRDTHNQYRAIDKFVYPFALPPISLFGVAVENTPPYKDVDHPRRLGDPAPGQFVAHLGTIRWDHRHAWWEVHPVKMVREMDPDDPALAHLRLAGRESLDALGETLRSLESWPAEVARDRGAADAGGE